MTKLAPTDTLILLLLLLLHGVDASYNLSGLHREVWMLNINDACFGALVLVAVILKRRAHSGVGASRRWKVLTSVMMVVAVVWRDATLWRETVDYMWGHHR